MKGGKGSVEEVKPPVAAKDKEKGKDDSVPVKPGPAREREAAEALLKSGATLTLITADKRTVTCSRVEDLPAAAFVVHSIYFNGKKGLTGKALGEAITGLSRLEELRLYKCPGLGDGWAAAAAGLASLVSVDLNNNPGMTDAVFKALAASRLRHLSVEGAFKGDALAAIGRITTLRRLVVEGVPFTDDDLKPLAALTGLTWLRLRSGDHAAFTGAGLAHLKALTGLEILELQATAIGDQGLRHVAPFTALQSLNLTSTRVTGEGFAHLGKLPRLTKIDLANTRLTDDGLKTLAASAGLRQIDISRTKVTRAGAEAFKNALPRCAITHEAPAG